MKKILHFLRSMKFGMILLFVVMVLSLAGSLIPQQESAMTYVNKYGADMAKVLMALRFHDIFHSWYFYTVEILLCINLIFCSIIRFSRTKNAYGVLVKRAENADADRPLPIKEKLLSFLNFRHFRRVKSSEKEIYSKNTIGFYGSFLTHLSILVVLLFGTLVLVTPKVTDQTVMVGDTLTLPDGTAICCESFHINNAEGKLDYASRLRVENAAKTQSKTQEIRVNEPLRFGEYKIYQQTYGTAGRIRVENHQNQSEETFTLTDACFLSIDGQNGIYFNALYPGFVKNEDGSYTLITNTSGRYEDPVYMIQSISDGMSASVLAFPGETIDIGDISFHFLTPVEYPGLRIKQVSSGLLAALYVGFALMVIALFLCFFTIPVCVVVGEEGYAIVSPKEQNGLANDIEVALSQEEAQA